MSFPQLPTNLPANLPANLPQLSQLTTMLTSLENPFEKAIRQTGLQLPKGPNAQLLSMQKSIEAGKPPSPPSSESLLKMPSNLSLPDLPAMLPGQKKSTSETATSNVSGQSVTVDEPFIGGASRDSKRSPDDPAIF